MHLQQEIISRSSFQWRFYKIESCTSQLDMLQTLITATPPDNLAILSESFLDRYALSVSERSFFICRILAWISALVEGSATMVVELLVIVTFCAMPSWSEVASRRLRPKSPERKSAPEVIKLSVSYTKLDAKYYEVVHYNIDKHIGKDIVFPLHKYGGKRNNFCTSS